MAQTLDKSENSLEEIMTTEERDASFVISITWGKSNNYVPASNEPFVWDGSLSVEQGTVLYLDHLRYKFYMWVQAVEQAERIFDQDWHSLLKLGPPDLAWTSSVKPGEAGGLEGIRFRLKGNSATAVMLTSAPVTIRFTLGELLEREHLRYHAGGKYSGVPLDVFLGPDARQRLSRKQFMKSLQERQAAGWMILPDDFSHATCTYAHSMYGTLIPPGGAARAAFPIAHYDRRSAGDCLVRLQMAALLMPYSDDATRWIDLRVRIGKTAYARRYCFTGRGCLPKLEEIDFAVPWSALERDGNELVIENTDAACPFILHRVFVGVEPASHRAALAVLPPLPSEPRLWIGYDTNLLTPQNGEVDRLIQMLRDEELGNFVLFRERGAEGSPEELRNRAAKLVEYGFRASTCGAPAETERILAAEAGDHYLGTHTHEISNLIYGWGEPDPLQARAGRTLPECHAKYVKRMAPCKMTGQAMPLQHLDYEAGVRNVITEIPGSHATLCLAGARGAARAFGKDFWGVHAANHVLRCPVDDETERRNFVLLNQCWLFGARLIYDEECALKYNHDTLYSFSDAIPYARRRQYQALYHYGSAIDLGRPIVHAAFLHGQYDCLVGGGQALPYIPPTKVWGMIGPETRAWEFDTPERGWEMLGTFMPGVWLYPVKQDPRAIRQFFAGTPHGQVDLLPILAPDDVMSAYELLVLPGWNTMTEAVHKRLLAYARGGGHLVLCAAQCTSHVTRDFLLEKRDFNFFRSGDLRELAGVRLGKPEGIVNQIVFEGDHIHAGPGTPGLKAELCGAKALAVDQAGRPVLIEHTVGSGRVWMLTVAEYWGHPALDAFRGALGKSLAATHRPAVHLSGDTNDVDFHHYQTDNGQRVLLLNTDWTSAGNYKTVTLHSAAGALPLRVHEGRLTHVLLQDDFAVAFETLPLIVDELSRDGDAVSFRVGGSGSAAVRIASPRKIGRVTVDGRASAPRDETLCFDLGARWSTRKVSLTLS